MLFRSIRRRRRRKSPVPCRPTRRSTTRPISRVFRTLRRPHRHRDQRSRWPLRQTLTIAQRQPIPASVRYSNLESARNRSRPRCINCGASRDRWWRPPRRRRQQRQPRPLAPARRTGSISSAIAPARSAANLLRPIADLAGILNKTSIIPAGYGERFVKRRGLFCMTVASRRGVVSSCVSRQDHDRSAVH